MANQKTLTVGGYDFKFVADLLPECDKNGKILEYQPQANYANTKNLLPNDYGKGSFCKFSIDSAGINIETSGVYIWLENDEIIYIGEAVNLKKRFNTGYGNISPRNCFEGGQSTNCKMNKVVLEESKKGNIISLYFYATTEHKKVEKELLSNKNISKKYNVKDVIQ